jgi:hypothetical protein
MRPNWTDIAYLLEGSPRQRAAHRLLHKLDIFNALRKYAPVLAGTVPLDIDTEHSDLDILCHAPDLDAFTAHLTDLYSLHDDFSTTVKLVNGRGAALVRLRCDGFLVEFFGQNRPIQQQHAYRHMLVEARLLAIGGESARQAIRQLKAGGLKTEPAFARYFHLHGDPYQTLLELEMLDDYQLRALLARRRFDNGQGSAHVG